MKRILIPEYISLDEAFEEKDRKRIEDLFSRGKGSDEKVLKLAQNMANSIDDYNKAQRRAEAAWAVLGKEMNPIADIFLKRAAELGGGRIEPEVLAQKIQKAPDVTTPKENPKVDFSTLDNAYSGRRGRSAKGVIFLPTYSAIAIWGWEITGQMSDGAWENSKPDEHWVFWANLEERFGIPEVQANGRPLKQGYNLAGLIEYVGDRMIAYGKFGKAVGPLVLSMNEPRSIVEDLPTKGPIYFKEWKAEQQMAKSYLRDEKMWQGLSQKVVDDYLDTVYTEKDLRKDLAIIKQAMNNVKVRYV